MNEDIKLTDLIEKEVLAFDDVSRFPDATLTDNITAVLSRDSQGKGIKIQLDDDESMIINLEIIVYYGVNIPQLCYDIQSKVKNYIEDITGLSVKAINIKVEGIDKR